MAASRAWSKAMGSDAENGRIGAPADPVVDERAEGRDGGTEGREEGADVMSGTSTLFKRY